MLIVLLTEWRIKHRCITLENIKFVNYEKIKTITGIALMAIFGFTSCQSEVDDVQGENQIQMPLIQQLQITETYFDVRWFI
jgi:hypothetical protein